EHKQEDEEDEAEEIHLKPQLIPQGSGGSGLLMGPDTQKELISSGGFGEFLISGDLLESGDLLISGDLSGSGDITGSTPSGVSGDYSSEGTSTELLLGSGESGDHFGSGLSGDLLISGASGISGVSGESGDSGDFGITLISGGMPTCLLCTCLGGSVYCDDLKLDSVPPLPKDTTHFYARYNRITKINKSDFAFMNKLKRIDLTANKIKSIDDDAFLGLPELEELVIRENHVSQLPGLPNTMTLIDGSHNDISSKGIHHEAFKEMTKLLYLYLTDNHIDYIPVPLPESLRSLHLQRNNIQSMHEDTFCNLKDFNYIRNALEDIRLDGNPINLSRTPQAYICLPRIPIGDLV
ncbi:unnamed protein product, partial [Tetraodon nigroviridis]